jgi:hypothetical protein
MLLEFGETMADKKYGSATNEVRGVIWGRV